MKTTLFWIAGAAGFCALLLLAWSVFFRQAPTPEIVIPEGGFAVGSSQTTGTTVNTSTEPSNAVTALPQNSRQKVFKIADGPVTGAAFVQTSVPTTTFARYVLQENGHVLDYPLDTPGALPRAVSNTTIPGTARALWASTGEAVYMQYFDGTLVKTVSLLFPPSTTTRSTAQPIRIQFLPDAIVDIASSPDGTQVAYLLKTSSGVDGYTVLSNGTGSKKIFSLGFTDVLLSWPSQNILLVQNKSAAGVPGAVFSVNVQSGAILPLIYGEGLTATADRTFSYILYGTAPAGVAERSSYIRDTARGTDVALFFTPIPEKCVWSGFATSTAYCATPLQGTAAGYLNLWHLGTASDADAIVSFTMGGAYDTKALAVPGSSDGGVASDIASLALSPDGKYLLFIKKGDRSLWGVRLSQ